MEKVLSAEFWIASIRRIIHAILCFGIALTVLTGGIYAFLQTDAANGYIRRKIVSVLEGATRARFEIGQLSGNLITGATLKNAAIYNPECKQPLFAFESIRVTYALPLLFTGRFYLPSVEVDGFSSYLVEGPDGRWNTAALLPPPDRKPAPEPPPESGRPFKLVIGEVTVKNAEMGLAWHAGGEKRELRFTDGECRTRLTISNRIENDIRHLSFRMPWPGVTFNKITGGIDYDIAAARLGFDATRFLTAEASDLTVDGGVMFRGGVNFDLDAAISEMAAEELGRLFSLPANEGLLSGRLEVDGPLDALAHRLELSADQMALKTEGTIDFWGPESLSLRAEGTVSHYDPETFPLYPIEGVCGDISAAVQVNVEQMRSPENRRIEIDISASGSEVAGYPVDTAEIRTIFAKDGIAFEKLAWTGPYGGIDARGRIDRLFAAGEKKPFKIVSTLMSFDPGVFPDLNAVGGALNGDLTLQGNLPPSFNPARSDFELTAHLRPSRLLDIERLAGDIELSWSDRQLTAAQVALESDQGRLDAAAAVNFNDDSCRVQFHAGLDDLHAFSGWLPAPYKNEAVSGAAELTGQLSGTWFRPDFSVQTDLNNFRCRIFSSEHARLEAAGTLTPDGLLASGNLDGNHIRYNGLAVSGLSAEWSISPDLITAETEVRAASNRAVLSGTISGWRRPEKAVVLDRFHLFSAERPPLVNTQPIAFRICGDRLKLDSLHLQSDNATLSADGYADLIPGGSLSSHLQIGNFDLQRIAGFVPALDKIQGTLSGDIRLSNTLAEPVIQASADLTTCGCYGISLSRIDAAADYRAGKLTFSADGSRTDSTALTAQGELFGRLSFYPFAWVPENNGFSTDIAAQGFRLSEFDLPFSDDYEADGTLDLKANLAGNITAPRIAGTMSVKDAHLNLYDYGLTYETVEGDVDFIKNTFIIRNLSIGGNTEGHLSASGQIACNDRFYPEAFDVNISGSDFHVPFRNAVFVRTEPQLCLKGTPNAPDLTGRIAVAGGKVFLDRLLKKQPAEIEVIELRQETDGTYLVPDAASPLSFIEPLAADIVVEIGDNLWVKGKEENLEIAGQVRLDKDHRETFKLYGTLYSVRGTYLFRNRLFRITKGEIRFLGLEDIDPNVNIEAQTRVQDATIMLRLTGSFKNLQLALDSEPHMQTIDIISYLMFGRPVAELSQGESFRAEEAALSITGQLAADQLKAILGDSFRLDLVHISTGNGDISKGTVSLGKYLAPNLFVTYNQGFTQEVPRSVEVDYEINRHFSLEAQIDEERTSAVDLIWKHDYSGFLEFLFKED